MGKHSAKPIKGFRQAHTQKIVTSVFIFILFYYYYLQRLHTVVGYRQEFRVLANYRK